MSLQFDHGGYYGCSDKILDFSSNINPLPIPKKIRRILLRKFLEKAMRYPDPFCIKLKQELSERLGVNEKMIVLGNGSTDIIYRIALAFKPKKVLIFEPTFSEYKKASLLAQAEVINNALNDEFRLPKVRSGPVDILFLCHPNNPTGNFLISSHAEVFEFQASYYVIDEAFIDFTGEKEKSFLSFVSINKNLIVLRSFTKFFPIAGLRIGYAIGSEKIIEILQRFSPPWNVNSVALEAALLFLRDENFAKKTVSFIRREKKFLERELKSLNFTVFPSVTNFLLIKLREKESSRRIKSELERKGIIVRDCSSFYGLEESFVRVSIRKRKENRKLIEALRSL